jgi:hypothetical protein
MLYAAIGDGYGGGLYPPVLQGGAKSDGGPSTLNPSDSDEAMEQKYFS